MEDQYDKKKILEEVHLKQKELNKNKEKQSEKIKNTLLNKKRKREEKDSYITAHKLVKDYREKQKSHSYAKKQIFMNKNRSNNFYDKSRENSPVLIIRIIDSRDRISSEIKDVLNKFNLKKLYSSVIIRYNKETYCLLNIIDSYVTWGYTNKKTITELVKKRGTCYNKSESTLRLLDNEEVEKNLSQHNIICIEDIIHELSNIKAKNHNKAMEFLGFFLLSPTEELKENTIKPYFKGGNTGFRGDEINSLCKKMI